MRKVEHLPTQDFEVGYTPAGNIGCVICFGLSVIVYVHILFPFVSACVVIKDRNTPNWSTMADDIVTQGGICSVWDLHSISVEYIRQEKVVL